MRVIGTAGHVDHGKSTLVQALTGIHPDRLKEEKEREMTIDLGFAWMSLPPNEWLPSGEEVGIVDVPGHRDFIENMLSGIGGIDAVLFVVAADEGVMPQTREHLAILDILQIDAGIIALTKIDMVQDPEWLELIEEDIRRVVSNTVLHDAPIIRVSSKNRQGIPELLMALSQCLSQRPLRLDFGKPRLPVDRVFTMAGFGTIVTGTLIDGILRAGEEVQVIGNEYSELKGRVRGLQTHKKKEDTAFPGSRTAVNLSGINVDEIKRGYVVSHPGDYKPTRRVDVRFHLLPDANQPFMHGSEVKLFIGTSDVVAKARLLGLEELLPGQDAWLQLELRKPVVTVRGDRYILRRPSPGETLGGGFVVDSHPKGRHKRFAKATLESLEALTKGSPAEILVQSLNRLGIAPLQDVIAHSNLKGVDVDTALMELTENHQLVCLEHPDPSRSIPRSSLVASNAYWEQINQKTLQEVENFHLTYPLRSGMPKEELKSRLKASSRWFPGLLRGLSVSGKLEESGSLVKSRGHSIQFTLPQRHMVDELIEKFKAAPYSPPSVKDCLLEVKEDIYSALLETGELIQVSSEVVFKRQDYDKMVTIIIQLIKEHGPISAAQVRDHFNTSRRYVLAVLEHLDAQGITLRDGDVRRLKKSQGSEL